MLNYNHLYYFFITGKLTSISRAAETLNISQPSLSSQIKVLEENIKAKLFEKSGRGLVLSQTGKRVFSYCERMFDASGDLENYLQNRSLLDTQKIRIAVSDQIERPFIADLIAEIHTDKNKKQNPLSVTSGSQGHLVEQLQLKKIDAFITNSPAYGEGLIEYASVDMPVCAFVSKEVYQSSEFRKKGAPFLATLKEASMGMVLPTDSQKLRVETDLYFQKNKIRKPIIFESDILSVVSRAVVDGVGLGFLPLPYMAEELYHGLVVNVGPDSGLWWHRIYLIVRKQEKQEDLLTDLRDIILSLKQDAHFYKKKRP